MPVDKSFPRHKSHPPLTSNQHPNHRSHHYSMSATTTTVEAKVTEPSPLEPGSGPHPTSSTHGGAKVTELSPLELPQEPL